MKKLPKNVAAGAYNLISNSKILVEISDKRGKPIEIRRIHAVKDSLRIKLSDTELLEDVQNAKYGGLLALLLLYLDVRQGEILELKSRALNTILNITYSICSRLFGEIVNITYVDLKSLIGKFIEQEIYRNGLRKLAAYMASNIDEMLLQSISDKVNISEDIPLSKFENSKYFKLKPPKTIIKELAKLDKAIILPRQEYVEGLEILDTINRGFYVLAEDGSKIRFLPSKELLSKLDVNGLMFRMRKLGGFANRTYLIEREEGNIVVAKFFDTISIVKWIWLKLWAKGYASFDVSAIRRLNNEFNMNRAFKKAGFRVPEILSIDIEGRIIVEEFIKGNTLKKIAKDMIKGEIAEEGLEKFRECGRLVGKIHSKGFTLGDANPGNFITPEKRHEDLFIVDLEQAKADPTKKDVLWDIATLIYYTAHYSYVTPFTIQAYNRLGKILEALLEGYLEYGDVNDVRAVADISYIRIYAPFTLPPALILARNKILKITK